MTLIQNLLRRLSGQTALAARSFGPTPLRPEHLKAVGGGNTESPYRSW